MVNAPSTTKKHNTAQNFPHLTILSLPSNLPIPYNFILPPPTIMSLPTEHTHLSTIFLAFRLATWHTHIRDAHTSGPQIMLYLSTTKPFRRHGWWSMFPSHIVGLGDELNKNAVLTTMSVLDVGHFTRLVGQMFEGAYTITNDPQKPRSRAGSLINEIE
jgi:hypothetical protein